MSKNLRNLLIGLGIILLGLSLWYFKSIVAYILISAILALIGQPLVDLLGKVKIKNFQFPTALNAAITLVLIWTLVVVFFRVFIPLIANQASELSQIETWRILESLEEPLAAVQNVYASMNSGGDAIDLNEYLSDKLSSVLDVSMLSGIFSSITGALGNLFIALFSISFITFFFLKEEGLFSRALLIAAPSNQQEKTKHFFTSVKRLLIRYFIGIGIEVLLVMTFVSLGLTIAGLKFETALVIGLFAGLMNVIPYVGPMIGASFGIIVSLATNLQLEFYTELLPLLGYVALVFMIVQICDNIFFQPLIYSSSVNAHPLEIFLVISIAGSLAGITGMVVAIPVYTILRVFAGEFFNKFRVVQALTNRINN